MEPKNPMPMKPLLVALAVASTAAPRRPVRPAGAGRALIVALAPRVRHDPRRVAGRVRPPAARHPRRRAAVDARHRRARRHKDPPKVVPRGPDERDPAAHRRPRGPRVGVLRLHRRGPDAEGALQTGPAGPARLAPARRDRLRSAPWPGLGPRLRPPAPGGRPHRSTSQTVPLSPPRANAASRVPPSADHPCIPFQIPCCAQSRPPVNGLEAGVRTVRTLTAAAASCANTRSCVRVNPEPISTGGCQAAWRRSAFL